MAAANVSMFNLLFGRQITWSSSWSTGIKRGVENEHAFKALWAKMSIDPNTGLYREVLTKPVEAEDSKFNTFSITDNAYITYINIGFWKDIESFEAAVGQHIQPPERRKPLEGPN